MDERSELVRYRVEHEKLKFISISEYVIFCLLYKHQWNTKSACFQRRNLLCNHNGGDLFMCEDNMLSSRVKIWSFRGKAHLVFHWCSYNKHLSPMITIIILHLILYISTDSLDVSGQMIVFMWAQISWRLWIWKWKSETRTPCSAESSWDRYFGNVCRFLLIHQYKCCGLYLSLV